MRGLRIWLGVLWTFLALNAFALVFGILTGGTSWWVNIFSILVLYGSIKLNQNTMRSRARYLAKIN